jgi:hypothetical protein
VQSRGSLAETSLRNLLETAQGERSTGTLTVRNGSGKSASLYFLFGHLFHAQSDGMAGDAAVVSALGWGGGEFEFDPKAKLPSDETVKAGIPELVQAAESGSEEVPEPPPSPPPDAREERTEHPLVQEKKVEAPQPRRGVKHRPQPKHGREPIPVPAGQVIYDSLKTSFVDFPRLITTLEKEGYTGYVRLLTEDASALILFREGLALECMYDAGDDQHQGLILGKQALQRFNEDVTNGHGVLDVVGLSSELIDGLYELTVSRPMYTELYASWVDMKALLKFLNDRKLSGSVMIRAGAGTGVIILSEGELAGAYTSESRDISDKPDRALALCEDPNAMIEIKSADTSTHTPLDIDEIVAGQRGPRMNPQVAQTAPPTPAPAPPPAEPATSQIPVVAQTATYPAMQREAPTPPSMPAMPMPQAAPTAPPASTGPQLDWAAIVAELQAMAEDQLGNRARKVKDILGAADPSIAGIEAAIDQVPSISLLFVDSSRLEQLAQEMRARLKSHY